MLDSQSSEPGFESLFVTVSKIGHFRSLHWCPCSLSCINEYLAIGSGGNVRDLALAHNCCLARMLPGEAELVSEWTGLPGEAKSVKHFERSNGLDTALYKNYLYLLLLHDSRIIEMEDSDSPFFKSDYRTRSKPSNGACGPVDVDPPGTAASAGRPTTLDLTQDLTRLPPKEHLRWQ